jgi:hypothetical protein
LLISYSKRKKPILLKIAGCRAFAPPAGADVWPGSFVLPGALAGTLALFVQQYAAKAARLSRASCPGKAGQNAHRRIINFPLNPP